MVHLLSLKIIEWRLEKWQYIMVKKLVVQLEDWLKKILAKKVKVMHLRL